MPNLSIRIPSDREPLVRLDQSTGEMVITRSWYLFLYWVFQRVGGATGDPIDTSAELIAAVEGLQSAPVLVEPDVVQQLQTELNETRERLAELTKVVQGISSGTML